MQEERTLVNTMDKRQMKWNGYIFRGNSPLKQCLKKELKKKSHSKVQDYTLFDRMAIKGSIDMARDTLSKWHRTDMYHVHGFLDLLEGRTLGKRNIFRRSWRFSFRLDRNLVIQTSRLCLPV